MLTEDRMSAALGVIDKTIEIFSAYPICRFVLAQDSDGKATDPNDIDACAFCAMGGMKRAARGDHSAYFDAFDLVQRVVPGRLPVWSDHPGRTAAEFVEVLKTAKSFAKAGVLKATADIRAAQLAETRCSSADEGVRIESARLAAIIADGKPQPAPAA